MENLSMHSLQIKEIKLNLNLEILVSEKDILHPSETEHCVHVNTFSNHHTHLSQLPISSHIQFKKYKNKKNTLHILHIL